MRTLPRLLAACFLAMLANTAAAQYDAGAPSATPATPLAIDDARIDETNAERAQSQPGNNAPFWRGVRESGENPGYSSLPGAEKGVLIQEFVQYPGSRFTTAGEAWRQVRNAWIIPYGGALLLIVVVAIGLFYVAKGAIGLHGAESGRVIERFTYFERAAHWTNAIAFVSLAISGIVMAFGKFFLLPIMGGTLFGWLSYALKNLHNFAGPVFAVSLTVVFLTFLRSNWIRREDITWLKKGGGMLSGKEVPSGRFNAGEKLVFWGGVLFLGLIVIGSGLVLDKLIPGMAYTRGDMQIANMVHGVAAVAMMCVFLGHIYIGTIGMKGAYKAMRTGYVDETWAREHHEYWYNDIKAGKIPAQRSASAPAEGKPQAAV
ncbi:formate dehydrogenase subunit gamma [Methylibium sp.]|uniref:formate dehydrogenase subunit gamma n=1 Tax=Methylibium sp. TaxID=2067992 RepID=UPI0018443E70|nr:formate dehydrogenase subunit gamma [Methylibium sp.]MBA3588788.1 formate dehydrogenase subunit gamma [Methylibium sp.]